MHTYRVELGENEKYRGGMKQLRLRFPAADGSAEIHRVRLLPLARTIPLGPILSGSL